MIFMNVVHDRAMKGFLGAGGVLATLVGMLALMSVGFQPTPAEMDRWVEEGTASRTQIRYLNHTVRDTTGMVLLDCRAGIDRLPPYLSDVYSCADVIFQP